MRNTEITGNELSILKSRAIRPMGIGDKTVNIGHMFKGLMGIADKPAINRLYIHDLHVANLLIVLSMRKGSRDMLMLAILSCGLLLITSL